MATQLTWLGHACFRLVKDGYTVVFDPYEDGSVPGLGNVRETADLVLCSHEHFDHNARQCVKAAGTDQQNPFTITVIDTYHDEVKGAKRGPNKIHLLEDGSVRIAHFGDLGCELTADQAALLKDLDAAMIPVGGFYTIGPKEAAALVRELTPKHVIPMHFRDAGAGFGFDVLAQAADYVKCAGDAVYRKQSGYDMREAIDAVNIILTPENSR